MGAQYVLVHHMIHILANTTSYMDVLPDIRMAFFCNDHSISQTGDLYLSDGNAMDNYGHIANERCMQENNHHLAYVIETRLLW